MQPPLIGGGLRPLSSADRQENSMLVHTLPNMIAMVTSAAAMVARSLLMRRMGSVAERSRLHERPSGIELSTMVR
jgi:hypothetical protein